MLSLAVRHDALVTNPVQQTSRLRREKAEPRSLSASDLEAVRTALSSWADQSRPGPKANSDMADTIELMLATGARIGEILELRWIDVHLDGDSPQLNISVTINTETGKGAFRKPNTKDNSNLRTVIFPNFTTTEIIHL